MTREDVKKWLPVLQAFAEGKTIQSRYNSECGAGPWEDIIDSKASITEYRIKPSPPSPACRPFKDCGELVAEYCKRFGVERKAYEMPQIWVMLKHQLCRIPKMLVTEIDENSIVAGGERTTYATAVDKYVFLDLSPFSVMEEASQ